MFKEKSLTRLLNNQANGDKSSIEKIYSQLLENYPNDKTILEEYQSWLSSQGEDRTANTIADYLVANDWLM